MLQSASQKTWFVDFKKQNYQYLNPEEKKQKFNHCGMKLSKSSMLSDASILYVFVWML